MMVEYVTSGIPVGMLFAGVLAGWLFARRRHERRMLVHAIVSFNRQAEEVEQSSAAADGGTEEGTPLPETPGEAAAEKPMRFIIDVMLLRQSFEHVCGAPSRAPARGGVNGFREVFHYAAGFKVDERTFVIGHLVPVKFSQQSAGGVRVADGSNIAVLESLDRVGLPLVAHFHSHPGFGRNANHPSMIDRRFQERLERGGHCAVGGIFSRDGYVRFFADDLDRFVVEVVGNNVKKVGDNEFKLQLENEEF